MNVPKISGSKLAGAVLHQVKPNSTIKVVPYYKKSTSAKFNELYDSLINNVIKEIKIIFFDN